MLVEGPSWVQVTTRVVAVLLCALASTLFVASGILVDATAEEQAVPFLQRILERPYREAFTAAAQEPDVQVVEIDQDLVQVPRITVQAIGEEGFAAVVDRLALERAQQLYADGFPEDPGSDRVHVGLPRSFVEQLSAPQHDRAGVARVAAIVALGASLLVLISVAATSFASVFSSVGAGLLGGYLSIRYHLWLVDLLLDRSHPESSFHRAQLEQLAEGTPRPFFLGGVALVVAGFVMRRLVQPATAPAPSRPEAPVARPAAPIATPAPPAAATASATPAPVARNATSTPAARATPEPAAVTPGPEPTPSPGVATVARAPSREAEPSARAGRGRRRRPAERPADQPAPDTSPPDRDAAVDEPDARTIDAGSARAPTPAVARSAAAPARIRVRRPAPEASAEPRDPAGPSERDGSTTTPDGTVPPDRPARLKVVRRTAPSSGTTPVPTTPDAAPAAPPRPERTRPTPSSAPATRTDVERPTRPDRPDRPRRAAPPPEPTTPRSPAVLPAAAATTELPSVADPASAAPVVAAPPEPAATADVEAAPAADEAVAAAEDGWTLRRAIEVVAVVAASLLAASLISRFVVQPYLIPSASMEPTLQSGDRIFVEKISLRLRDPQRGDIVVFEPPAESGISVDRLIKRVLGLPGETVELRDGQLVVDGEALTETYLEAAFGSFGPLTVPEGHVVVFGDNRDDSQDSRAFGPVPLELVEGRALMRFWPITSFGGF